MFGAFLYGGSIYADAPQQAGVYNLFENITSTDNSPDFTVIFALNEFILGTDMTTATPDRVIADSITLNDWLTVKSSQTDSTFTD